MDEEENSTESEESKEKINMIIEDLTARKEKYQELRTEMREAGVKQKSLTDPDWFKKNDNSSWWKYDGL